MKLAESILLHHATRGVLVLTAMLLSACMVGPDFQRPSLPASQHYDTDAEKQIGDGFGKSMENEWWVPFASAKLDDVMRKAIDGNLDLEAADATIAQADEAVISAGGALSPRLDFNAQAGRQRAGSTPHTGNAYSVGPHVSFDLDLFGGNRRRVEGQSALAELQRHRFDAAYLTVTGDIAHHAFQLASARAQIDAVQNLLANDRKNLDLIQKAHAYGSATQFDIALATTQLAQDETLLPPLMQQRDSARHALSVLAGKGPADWVPPDFDLSDFALPANLPFSLPSELARQRPDILAAEAELHAASASIGVATADLYPHLQLSGALSQVAPGPGTLWGLAAGLAGPIASGGTLQANRRGTIDGYDASLARYRQTVVRALGQVADVLQAIHHDGEEMLAQERALSSAEASLRLNREGYRAGEIAVLQVLDAERTYQRALIGHIRARTAQYMDTAELSVSLGGRSSGALAIK